MQILYEIRHIQTLPKLDRMYTIDLGRDVNMNGIVNLNTRVSQLLNRMGVPDYTAGYSFLHTATMSVYKQLDLLGSITEYSYVAVVNKHKMAMAHVEEELEYALLTTLLSGDHVMLQKALHILHYRQPTLREFIEMPLEYIRSAEQTG